MYETTLIRNYRYTKEIHNTFGETWSRSKFPDGVPVTQDTIRVFLKYGLLEELIPASETFVWNYMNKHGDQKLPKPKRVVIPPLPEFDFIALDVETANRDKSSICQIGICIVENGLVKDKLGFYVNPECNFENINIRIHKITAQSVAYCKKFPEVMHILSPLLEGKRVVYHNSFDRTALHDAAQKYQIQLPMMQLYDSGSIAKYSIPRYAQKGYGLPNLCSDYGIDMGTHHNAIDDAVSCARVLLAVFNETGNSFGTMRLSQGKSSLGMGRPQRVSPKKNNQGEVGKRLSGKTVVFTGDFSKPRPELETLAKEAGLSVRTGISKSLNYLVIGETAVSRLVFMQPSKKKPKAESLNAQGANIQFLSEDQFMELIRE